MGALQLKSVFKTYPNGHQAVRGVSLDIEDGEFLVLVGPSGCGKSTMLRSISGLEDITEGEIYIADERVDELAPAKRDIAMVFQNYALYPHMTVYKNMAYGLKNRGYNKVDIDAKVQVAAKMLQLEEYLLRKPSQLSGGQRQRVAMGRAIVRNPKLFLFDEPLSNLDASLRLAMRLEIKSLQRELKITSVFVTHDQVEAMTLADRLAVINNGQIEQIGTPRDVYHQPRSVFVARFMGSPAMNLLTATHTTGGHLQFMNGETFELPASVKEQLSDGQKIYLGLRPEHVKVAAAADTVLLKFDVGLCEELGSSQLLHGKVAGEDFSLNLPQFDQHDETVLGLTVEEDKIHLFDFESGLRIGYHS